MDAGSGIGVAATGHAHPEVVAAVQQQAARFLHISSDFYHEGWVALSEALAGVAPFPDEASVFLCNSGAEAVEAALKLASYHTGRSRFIGFLGSFHGRTQGALMLTGSKAVQRRGFAAHNTVTHVPYPNPYRPLLAAQEDDAGFAQPIDDVERLQHIATETTQLSNDEGITFIELGQQLVNPTLLGVFA